MGWVRAHHHRAVAGSGALDGGGRGDRSLAHSALAREQDHSHKVSVSATVRGAAEAPRPRPWPALPVGWRTAARAYLTIRGTAIEPAPRRTTIATPTTARRTRSLVKYGTRSNGIAGSADAITRWPPRTLTTWFRAPKDISTARTRA